MATRKGTPARLPDFAPPVRAQPPAWNRATVRSLDGGTMLRRLVAACLAQILPNAAEIAAGSRDPEHVHQLRVGLRRLRTALREMAPYAGALDAGWEKPARRVFDALGAMRDHRVFVDTLAPGLRRAGAPLADYAAHDAPAVGEADLGALVRGSAFQASLRDLKAFADQLGPATPSGRSAWKQLRHRLTRLQRHVMRDARGFETLPFDQQHRARKRLKRLRYLAAFVFPLFPPGRVAQWLDRVKPAQDALGKHIDLLMAARHFTAQAKDDPRAWFAAGWLQARSIETASESRRRLKRLERANVFW